MVPGKPKGPPSAYILFSAERRQRVIDAHAAEAAAAQDGQVRFLFPARREFLPAPFLSCSGRFLWGLAVSRPAGWLAGWRDGVTVV